MEKVVNLSFKQLKEIEELRHNTRMEELRFEKAMIDHRLEEEMGAIRLKNANMNRMLDKKEAIRERWDKRYVENKERYNPNG